MARVEPWITQIFLKKPKFKFFSGYNTLEIERWVYYAYWKFKIMVQSSVSCRPRLLHGLLLSILCLFAYIIQKRLAEKVRRSTILLEILARQI
mmetsp:Transcript_30296/g.33942  ORF Transcript_30296/g.33942 Transcript_30296/m.33942 type:complete len:93 (-) Transcript_30296:395-673(-)